MSESKQVQGKWHAEEMRAERKARLARMKSKDGGKKPIRTRNTTAIVITAIILVIALLATGVWYAVRLGVPQRTFTALTVGDVNIKAVELNYYYHYILSYVGIDPTTADGQAQLAGASGSDEFATYGDMLKDYAAQQVQQYVMLSEKAAEAGLTLDDSDQEQLDSILSNLTDSATQSGTTVDSFLAQNYGTGLNLAAYKMIWQRSQLAEKYAEHKKDSLTYTADQIKTYYEANKNDFDVVDYRTFYLAADIATDATDEQKTTAMASAKAKADEMLGKIADEDSFKTQCIAYAAEADKESYQTTDKSLVENGYKSALASYADQADWMFDPTRKAGDKTVIEGTSGYYVLYFINRSQADFKHVNVRHILISANQSSATAEEIATAKTKAESILAGYEAGAKTEDAFAELAKVNSADSNASTGGLYENVEPGDMVAEFENWCFDDSRKTGDTGIVQTTYGFHVMYFVGHTDKSDWEYKVESTLRSTDYNTYFDEEIKNFPYSLKSFGMKFVS